MLNGLQVSLKEFLVCFLFHEHSEGQRLPCIKHLLLTRLQCLVFFLTLNGAASMIFLCECMIIATHPNPLKIFFWFCFNRCRSNCWSSDLYEVDTRWYSFGSGLEKWWPVFVECLWFSTLMHFRRRL